MRGQRDAIPAALAVIAEYHLKGCVDLTLTAEETGQVYRWPGLSRDDPRISDGSFLLERSIKTTRVATSASYTLE